VHGIRDDRIVDFYYAILSCLKNDVRIRSEFCWGWYHIIRIRKLSESYDQAQLSGNSVFTVIDMQTAECILACSSEWFLVIPHYLSYPWVRKRVLRMGLSSASEIVQKRNEEIFADISGVHIIAGDLIIAAVNPQEHEHIMRSVLTRAQEKRRRFKKVKIQFKIDAVQCMGHIVSAPGLKPDPHKVQAIANMPPPHDVPSLQRLLGIAKYLSQYIPNKSTITAPVQTILERGSDWKWTASHDQAFLEIKNALVLLQPLHWRCVECVIHHEWHVREEQHRICGARTSNNRVIAVHYLYFCLLPQCEALRTCRSGFSYRNSTCTSAGFLWPHQTCVTAWTWHHM